ncbi:Voltage-gated ClC-type chloride channel ClcB [Acidibacillus sp. S0AB]|uniref:Voltage-gated ClC-type chloride channel ClcB n=2 Tax=Sulfoacidibacillus ferrooxidans TaxID=2005001 RepID=A0A9X1VBA3_9BACL|nr:Voltage-gated ClC-type chloride channel ClcB [Sulfoacidibacillus ferrooxidans]
MSSMIAPARPKQSPLQRWLIHPYREPIIVGLLAILIGVIGGLGAILFRGMIHLFASWFSMIPVTHSPLRALIPALGLLLVGLITHFFAKEVKGHGVPQLLESLALRGGKIRPRVAFFGIIAPAITLGAGGSVGREGPIALIGGAFGSILGQRLRLSDKYISLLLASGAAAGIAATFNAPIAGGFFGLEIILGSYAMGAIMPVFLAAVTGSTVFDAIMGNHPVLQTTPYPVIHPIALLFMIILGLLAGTLGIAYSKGLTFSEDLLERWRVPFWVKNITGGALVGVLGLLAPEVLGVGYPSIHLALGGQLAIGTILLLFVLKYVATLTTVGSGGSGGVFAPSLFLGAMLGALYGDVLRFMVPGLIPHPEIYAIAGMGAIFAAAAQAPFVSITILLEVTGDYQLTPVVMAACVTAFVVHGLLTRDSMYTVKLSRLGINILRGNEVRPTERISVQQAMEPLAAHFSSDDTLVEAYHGVNLSRDHVAVITDHRQQLQGIMTLETLRSYAESMPLTTPLSMLDFSVLPVIVQSATLEEAMRLFSLHDVTLLPVVDDRTNEVVGTLTQRDVVRAYSAYTLYSTESNAKVQQLKDYTGDVGQFVSIPLKHSSPIVESPLSEISIPKQAVIVSVKRGGEVVVPHGNTVLKPGDELLVFISPLSEVDLVLAQIHGAVLL